jgi:FKBP-type peptidyl-prolyl cis-trans isomerase
MVAVGCGRREVAPAEPGRDEMAVWREETFGPSAAAPDIAWRSSGLGIRMLETGEGTPPQMTDTVRVHYTGRLKEGTVFDDTRARGRPEDLVVNRLIIGWASAMQAMKPGSRAEIFIPPQLGYGGVRAAGVPAGAGVIFDVELIAVNPPDARARP